MAAVPPDRSRHDDAPTLDRFHALYPDLPQVAVAEAVERAHMAAAGLGGGKPLSRAQLDRLTRDRLDVLRERAARRRSAHRHHARPL